MTVSNTKELKNPYIRFGIPAPCEWLSPFNAEPGIDTPRTCLIKQLYVEKKVLNESYPEAFNHLSNLVDIGDIVGARGSMKRTDKGELSIKVSSFEMLTKAILPLPDKFHGLQDVEKRYRQRSVSLSFSRIPGVSYGYDAV